MMKDSLVTNPYFYVPFLIFWGSYILMVVDSALGIKVITNVVGPFQSAYKPSKEYSRLKAKYDVTSFSH